MTQAYIEIMNLIEVPLKGVVDSWLGNDLRMASDSFGKDVTPGQTFKEVIGKTAKWRVARMNLLIRLAAVVPAAVKAQSQQLDENDVEELQTLAGECV